MNRAENIEQFQRKRLTAVDDVEMVHALKTCLLTNIVFNRLKEPMTVEFVGSRLKFLNAFSDEARTILWEELFQKMGSSGRAHHICPLPEMALLDPDIFTGEPKDTPKWLKGEQGRKVQRDMAAVAARRYFAFGQPRKPDDIIFTTGKTWAGFGRLSHHLDAVLVSECGLAAAWSAAATQVNNDIWSGKHDDEIMVLSLNMAAELTDAEVLENLRRMFVPFVRLFGACSKRARLA
jgi:hypothetical protein